MIAALLALSGTALGDEPAATPMTTPTATATAVPPTPAEVPVASPPVAPLPPPPAAPAQPSVAEGLTARARAASATGDCRLVALIAQRVRSLDTAYYERTFTSDPEITACKDHMPSPPRPVGLPRVTITAGLGSVYFLMGLAGEVYFAGSRLSVAAGAGWAPNNDPTGITRCDGSGKFGLAGALRGYTAGLRHRGFAELSYGATSFSHTSSPPCVEAHYGPGLLGGYQYAGVSGFTFVVAIGASQDEVLGTAPLFDLGMGYTFR